MMLISLNFMVLEFLLNDAHKFEFHGVPSMEHFLDSQLPLNHVDLKI
jgi:hypothetical protein